MRELESYRQLFEEALTHEDDFLGRALAYVRSKRGKMMRPLLVLLIAREKGEIGMSTLRAAVTLELLHTASLVHDDVVDESGERRGQASANSMYGNKVAVLLGDYILSLALQQAARTNSLEAVRIVAELGATLSEGEVYQLANIRQAHSSEEAYFQVIHRKTAALFAACGELAAHTAQGDEDFIRAARSFGENVGICFQIRDDIFDYYDDSSIGKPTGNDMAEGKLTLPALYVLTHTSDPEMNAVASRIKSGIATAEDIRKMLEQAKVAGGIDYAWRVMESYRQKAEDCLQHFNDPMIRQSLHDYLQYVVKRTF